MCMCISCMDLSLGVGLRGSKKPPKTPPVTIAAVGTVVPTSEVEL
jgi:hypothetical protein